MIGERREERVFFVRTYEDDGTVSSAGDCLERDLFKLLQATAEESTLDDPPASLAEIPDKGKFLFGDAIIGNEIGFPRVTWCPSNLPQRGIGFLYPFESGGKRGH
jgi:hypothetical protein